MSKIKTWFLSLKKSHQFAVSVLVVHLSAILWMSIDHWFDSVPKNRHPIFVRTIHPPAAPMHVETAVRPAAASPAPIKKPAAPPTHAATAKKKEKAIAKAPVLKKAEQPKKTTAAPLTKKTIPSQTIQEIEKSFSALSSPKTTSKPDIQLPSVIQTKSVIQIEDATVSEQEGVVSTTYHVNLVEMLQRSLQLPELGDVRVKISISSPGTLASVQILDTKSSKNSEWLKNQLPLLELPCFSDFGIVDTLLEFTITFRNVENF